MSTNAEPIAALTLAKAGLAYRLHWHPAARNQAELHLTGLDVDTSAKTLAFELPDGALVLAAIPGRARLKYANLARALGVSRSSLRPAESAALAARGMSAGGVTPICDDRSVRLVVHEPLLALDVVYCGSGVAEASIELSPALLVRLRPDLILADLCD